MAYIPPHKRQDKGRPSRTPEFFVPFSNRNRSLRPQDSKIDKSGKIMYADRAISRWFPVGLSENDQFPSYVHLEPVSLESLVSKSGEKPHTLVKNIVTEEDNELKENYVRSPWVIIAENVQQDLLSSFEILKNEMNSEGLEKIKPRLVARLGKILFHGSPSLMLGSVEKNQVDETILRQLKRTIHTNIPSLYMENITNEVVPKVGVDFEEEKDIYHVRLSDHRRPNSTVSCKCYVKADKKLLLYKVELNQVRQMVVDVSCLDKNIDLRLMLCSKRIITAPTDDELKSISDLISSAVLDSDVKGGLRWPLGNKSSGNRYSVIGVWHTITKAYKSPSLRVIVRHADRFDFKSGTGEVSREIYLKLKGISSELQEKGAESESVCMMLKDSLRLIWDHFLSCDRFLI